MSVYNFFGRASQSLYRALHPGWKAQGQVPNGPAVYLVHHQNMAGPIYTVAFLPVRAHLWVLDVFMLRKPCFNQYYKYTFTQRFGWPKPLALCVAGLLCVIVPPFMRCFGTIPVYRGRQDIGKTMEASQKALARGESIILCPDIDYADPSPEMGTVYMGFLKLEQAYCANTGKHLAFVPTYCSKFSRRLMIGEPLYFTDTASFRSQRKHMAKALKNGVNELGKLAGDIPGGAYPAG